MLIFLMFVLLGRGGTKSLVRQRQTLPKEEDEAIKNAVCHFKLLDRTMFIKKQHKFPSFFLSSRERNL